MLEETHFLEQKCFWNVLSPSSELQEWEKPIERSDLANHLDTELFPVTLGGLKLKEMKVGTAMPTEQKN